MTTAHHRPGVRDGLGEFTRFCGRHFLPTRDCPSALLVRTFPRRIPGASRGSRAAYASRGTSLQPPVWREYRRKLEAFASNFLLYSREKFGVIRVYPGLSFKSRNGVFLRKVRESPASSS